MLLYDGAVQEAQFLHGRDAGNEQRSADALFFSIFRKTGGRPIQRSYRLPQLEQVVAAAHGQADVYLSQSSFHTFGRKAINFKQTRAAWVDLDIYRNGRMLDSAMISEIIHRAESIGIPPPTSIISSGRGCYLKWFFQVPVTRQQLPVWNLLQSTLTAAFSGLCADINSRDISRVFRLLDSKNSKSGETVRAVEGSGQLYDFSGFCAAVEAFRAELITDAAPSKAITNLKKLATPAALLAQDVARGSSDALALYAELNQPIMMKSMSGQSLNWQRFCDLRDVYAGRGGIPVGERDKALFWMLNFLSHAGVVRSQHWNTEIQELLKAFPVDRTFDPLGDGSMNTLLNRLKSKEAGKKIDWRGVQIDPLYRPSNDFLIDAFAIQRDEMSKLTTIISPIEKRVRVDAQHPGRDERRSERTQWREEVAKIFTIQKLNGSQEARPAKTVKIAALARELGVERTRVSRYWKQLTSSATDTAIPVRNSVDVAPKEPLVQPRTAKQASEIAALSMLAHNQAREAQKAANAMALERKMVGVRDAWAQRKLRELMRGDQAASLDAQADPNQHDSSTNHQSTISHINSHNTTNSPNAKEASMSTESLRKRLALYRAAAGSHAPAAHELKKPTSPSPNQDDDHALSAGEKHESSVVDFGSAGVTDRADGHADGPQAQPATSAKGQVDGCEQPVAAQTGLSLRQRLAQASKDTRRTVTPSRETSQPISSETPAVNEPGVALVEGGPRAPKAYPGHDDWPSNEIAPGSHYSLSEWQAAAVDNEGNQYWVVEIQTVTQSWLVQYMRPTAINSQTIVNGKVSQTVVQKYPSDFVEPGMSSILGQMFDGSIWLSPRAANRFPGSSDATITLANLPYEVVRARLDYLNPDRSFKVGTTVKFSFDLDAYIAQKEAQSESAPDDHGPAPTCS